MAPLKAGWLSHVITYLVCLVSTVGMGGKRKEKSKAPQKTTKIIKKKNIFIPVLQVFLKLYHIPFSQIRSLYDQVLPKLKNEVCMAGFLIVKVHKMHWEFIFFFYTYTIYI